MKPTVYAIDFGTDDEYGFDNTARAINYNATTIIRSNAPVLEVASDGTITRNVNVLAVDTPDEIVVAGITAGHDGEP